LKRIVPTYRTYLSLGLIRAYRTAILAYRQAYEILRNLNLAQSKITQINAIKLK